MPEAVTEDKPAIADADELRARTELDRAYVLALREGHVRSDLRVGETAKPGWEWTSDISTEQVQRLSGRSRQGRTLDQPY